MVMKLDSPKLTCVANPLADFTSSRQSPGYSLVELMAVIGIMAVLVGLLIPVAGSIRSTAREVEGGERLRQIGMAIGLFSQDHHDHFPPGVSGGTDYATILSPYIGGKGKSWGDSPMRSPVFKDPAADDARGNYHFSANPHFMPDIQRWDEEGPRPDDLDRLISRHRATRPSEQILLADGCQVDRFGYNSSATLYSVSGIWGLYPSLTSDNPVARGPDIMGSGGHLRWRAAGGQGVKCLFVDGRVAVMREGELLQRHFQRDR